MPYVLGLVENRWEEWLRHIQRQPMMMMMMMISNTQQSKGVGEGQQKR